jgi:hypothetical protein
MLRGRLIVTAAPLALVGFGYLWADMTKVYLETITKQGNPTFRHQGRILYQMYRLASPTDSA